MVNFSKNQQGENSALLKHRDNSAHNQEGLSLTSAWTFVSLVRDSEDNFVNKI